MFYLTNLSSTAVTSKCWSGVMGVINGYSALAKQVNRKIGRVSKSLNNTDLWRHGLQFYIRFLILVNGFQLDFARCADWLHHFM